ncbi:MAG: LicD family protein [Bacteroidales bacterium]|nr:LicD family protein [Bacteroidales bacterium]
MEQNKNKSFLRDFAVTIAVKLGIYPKIVASLNRQIAKREAAAIKKNGLKVLKKIDEVLTKEGVTPFFVFGLLLGAYREKGFIPYDYDLDIGIMDSERPENLLDIMRRNGFVLKRQFYFKDSGRISIEQFEYDKVPVDFYYFFEKDENTIATIVSYKHEYKDWKEANETDGFPSEIITAEKTTFSRKDFLGIQFNMPDNAASWLAGFYGSDFMTPVKNWSSEKSETCRRPYPIRQYRNLEIVEQQAKL